MTAIKATTFEIIKSETRVAFQEKTLKKSS